MVAEKPYEQRISIMGIITTNTVFIPTITQQEQGRDGEMSRLLSAALVDNQFCELLLSEPDLALAHGYNGESFLLSYKEKQFVMSTPFQSLPDLAEGWVKLNHQFNC